VSLDGPSDKVPRFEKHILVYLDDLYRVALRLTGQVTEAEDLVQDTCLRDGAELYTTALRGVALTWWEDEGRGAVVSMQPRPPALRRRWQRSRSSAFGAGRR
jgi:sigma-70-like protein